MARVASANPTLNGFPADERPRPTTRLSSGRLKSTRQAEVFVPPVSTARNKSTSSAWDEDFVTSVWLAMGHQCTGPLLLRWSLSAVRKCPCDAVNNCRASADE